MLTLAWTLTRLTPSLSKLVSYLFVLMIIKISNSFTGAKSILEAFDRYDFPEDKDRIFLTSWGEWWDVDVIKQSIDKDLQDKWSFSQEEIEKDAGIV